MRRKARALFVLCCTYFLLISLAGAQQYRFINYTRRDGLPNTRVKCLLQDKTGFIWIGTQDGLFRYDGYTFKGYYRSGRDSNSLVQNDIMCLFQDSKGYIWVGTYGFGVSRFDPVTGTFRNYQYNPSDSNTMGGGVVYSILEDKIGAIWFATAWSDYPVSKLDPVSNSFTRYRPGGKNRWGGGYSLAIDKNGLLYTGFHDTVGIYNPFTNTFIKPISGGLARTSLIDGENKLWMGYYAGPIIGEYDIARGAYVSHVVENATEIYDIAEKSRDELWIADREYGLGIYDKRMATARFIVHEDAPYSIQDGQGATCLLIDNQGSLWIGLNDGLSQLNPRHQLISWNGYLGSSDSLAEKLFEFEKFIPDKKSNTIYAYAIAGDGVYKIQNDKSYDVIHNPRRKLNDQVILDILVDHLGELWVIDWDHLFKLDKVSGKLIYIPLPMDLPSSGKPPMFTSLFEDEFRHLWIGTLRRGLVRYDPNTGSSTVFSKETRSDFTISDYIQTSGVDRKGNIWFYSDQGICFYNSRDNTFTNCYETGVKTKGSPIKGCRGVSISEDGRIWIGTSAKGVLCYDPASGKMLRLTTTDGLANDQVNDMVIDPSGKVWIGTKNGLSCLEPRDLSFTNYFEEDGLRYAEITSLSIIRDILYIGQKGGYCTAALGSLRKNPWVPPVVITSFKVFGNEYSSWNQSSAGKRITLSYKQNHFSFDFAGLSFTSPEKNQYAYMLEGYDEDWISAGNRRYAAYTYIPGGNYTFRVKASNSDGVWNEAGISIPLKVIPPFWKTWWFRLLLAISIPAAVFYFVNRRIRFIKKRASEKLRLQKQLAALEMKALRAQMNPHFLFNALNSIQHQIITDDTKNAFTYLDKFGRLLRMILDNSERPLIRLQDELDGLQLYIEIEALRFQHSFHYSIEVDADIDTEAVLIPGMLLQPYVENAIWHGLLTKVGDPRLGIQLSQSEDILHCTIEDNGIGREKAKEQPRRHTHKSKGMQITEDRLNVIGQLGQRSAKVQIIDLKNENGESAGTRVEIAIPLVEEHEKNYA